MDRFIERCAGGFHSAALNDCEREGQVMGQQWRKAWIFSLLASVSCLASVISVYAADGVRDIMQSQADASVASSPIVINQPGGYRLISNILAEGNAIEIAAKSIHRRLAQQGAPLIHWIWPHIRVSRRPRYA
jgi:hypothetical protein